MAKRSEDAPTLAGVPLSHLDQPVFDGAGATKGDLVGYLDAVHERMLPELRDRALSVVRARLGQKPFMQKNLPKYAPDWIRTTTVWANASKREVHYPVCDDRRTLVWLANQRAVEYHPALMKVDSDRQTHLILDLDPPDDVEPLDGFRMAVAAALLVRQALEDAGLSGGVKTSGAKGVHVFVPLREDAEIPDVAAATRALAARAAAARPGCGDHRVRPRGARRQGVRRLDQGGRRDRGGGVQPAGAARRPGVVPGHLGRARAGAARRLHDPDRGRAALRGRPVGRRHLVTAGAPRRPGGGGPRDPDRPGGRHARGQAAQAARRSVTRPRRPPRTRRHPAAGSCRAASRRAPSRPRRGRS